MKLSSGDYQHLAEFRYCIRRFLQFSEQRSREHDLEPQQHQALLALKGLPTGTRPTVRELAGRLLLRHHSTVELVNRLAETGLVRRISDPQDKRQILIHLTARGTAKLRSLSLAHREEIRVRGPELSQALRAILRESRSAETK